MDRARDAAKQCTGQFDHKELEQKMLTVPRLWNPGLFQKSQTKKSPQNNPDTPDGLEASDGEPFSWP